MLLPRSTSRVETLYELPAPLQVRPGPEPGAGPPPAARTLKAKLGLEPEAEAPKKVALVVDDEQALRFLAKMTLERNGFRVLEAQNGQEGVEMFRKAAATIDAVILDLTMPVMDGVDALREIRKIRPDASVILWSGYHADNIADVFAKVGPCLFLKKPFGRQALLDAVDKALSRRSQGQEPVGRKA